MLFPNTPSAFPPVFFLLLLTAVQWLRVLPITGDYTTNLFSAEKVLRFAAGNSLICGGCQSLEHHAPKRHMVLARQSPISGSGVIRQDARKAFLKAGRLLARLVLDV